MGFFKRKKKVTKICPNCKKPVLDGTVFCDSCGLRQLPPPTCTKCNLPLAPETNFCEACGTPVGTVPPLPPETSLAEENMAVLHKKGRSSKAKKSKKRTKQNAIPEVPAQQIQAEPPQEKQSVDAAPEQEIPKGESVVSSSTPSPLPVPEPSHYQDSPRVQRKVFLFSCILVLCLFLVLAVLTGFVPEPTSQQPAEVTSPVVVPSPQGDLKTTPAATAPPVPEEIAAMPSLTPGPTRVPPESLQIWFQAEREPITNVVTVIFDGGKGQRAVREVLARLTRSDGQVLTQVFKPTTAGKGATLQGTRYADRLEVIIMYNTGDQYTVIDKIFEYKKRE